VQSELEEEAMQEQEKSTQQYDSWDDDLREHQQSQHKPGGKKYGFFWKLSETPVKFHPVLPEPLYTHPTSGRKHPFRTGFRHFVPGRGKASGTYVECAYERDKTSPCVVHAYAYPELYNLTNVKRDAALADCKANPYFAIGGFVEEEFHLVVEKENGKEYNRRVLCTGRGCEECQKGSLIVFGKKGFLEMSPSQWQQSLHPCNKQIENSFCACGGDLFVSCFCCTNCGKVILDVSLACDRCNGQNLSIDVESKQVTCMDCQRSWSALYTEHKQIYEESLDVHKCKDCGHEGFLRAERFCSQEGCKGFPMSIFDAQITLHKSGEKTSTKVFVDTYSIQPLDERLFLPEFQGNDEIASKIVEAHKKALNLEYLLQPKNIEDQCHDLGRPNPFTSQSRAQSFARYDGEGSSGT